MKLSPLNINHTKWHLLWGSITVIAVTLSPWKINCMKPTAVRFIRPTSPISSTLAVSFMRKQVCSFLYHIFVFYYILGCVLSLQEVALRQRPPTFAVLCYPCPYCSLLPHSVISSMTFWSSNWSYTFYLILCASNSQSIISHSANVSSSFQDPETLNEGQDTNVHSS